MEAPGLLYAVRQFEDPGEKRVPRAAQSAAAQGLVNHLASQLPSSATTVSKSHSRAVAAAAVLIKDRPDDILGCDIEYVDAARPWQRMFTSLVERDALADLRLEDFYRCWTFAEAFFKATGHWPEQQIIAGIAVRDTLRGVTDVVHGLHLVHEVVFDRFILALVWRGAHHVPKRVAF